MEKKRENGMGKNPGMAFLLSHFLPQLQQQQQHTVKNEKCVQCAAYVCKL
jgi:hypothetical protein